MKIESELIRRRLDGWTVARSLPEAEPVEPAGDGLRSKCNQPGRDVEVFALRADEEPESPARLAAAVAASPQITCTYAAPRHSRSRRRRRLAGVARMSCGMRSDRAGEEPPELGELLGEHSPLVCLESD